MKIGSWNVSLQKNIGWEKLLWQIVVVAIAWLALVLFEKLGGIWLAILAVLILNFAKIEKK